MGRHFVFKGQTLLNFKPIVVCAVSSLCYVTQIPFLSLPTWLWVSLWLLSWEREGNQRSLMFFWPQLSVFTRALFYCVCYTRLCSTYFVETDTFPNLYCMFQLFLGLIFLPDD